MLGKVLLDPTHGVDRGELGPRRRSPLSTVVIGLAGVLRVVHLE
jgi:hypothetical protein